MAIAVDNVTVDRDFARFGSKSYAINKINTVEVRENQPNGRGGAVLCGAIASVCALAAVGKIGEGKFSDILTLLIVMAVFGGIAYNLWQQSKIIEYKLYLMTSSSETQAFVTRDRDEVLALRKRIEGAMTGNLL